MALSAGHRVANITELLENILLQLVDEPGYSDRIAPANRTVLLSQRVCKAFRNVIMGSPKLRQKLFFTPPSANQPGLASRYYNPLFRALLQDHSSWKGVDVTFYWSWLCTYDYEKLHLTLCRWVSHVSSKRSSDQTANDSWKSMYAWNYDFGVGEIRLDGEVVDLSKKRLKNPTMGEIFEVAFGKDD